MATVDVHIKSTHSPEAKMGAKQSSARHSTDLPAEQVHTQTRHLELGDYHKGYLSLLSQLTKVGDYDQATFEARFRELEQRKDDYKIVVIEDTDKQKVIASATLMIERKFIRNCGKCGHIEDVVVDTTYRGHNLGKRVIEALMGEAEAAGCYKVILDCSEENAPFYQKCGLTKKELQMVKYL